MEITNILITFIIGIASSFIGAFAGSAGLINIPILILLGLPPHIAIATNKFGAIGLKIGAFAKYNQKGVIKKEHLFAFIIISILAALIGTKLLLIINKEFLSKVVIVLLIIVLPLIFLKSNLGIQEKNTSKIQQRIGFVCYFFAQIFSAFFGGGAGTIVMYVFMNFFGLTIIQSAATALVPSFVLNVMAFTIFALNGYINFELGAALFLGMLIGGHLGAKVAVEKGNSWVKRIFVVVMVCVIAKMIFDIY